MSWITPVETPTTQDFHDLFDNKISSIIIENFLTPTECEKICQEILAIGLSPFDYDFHDEATDAYRVFDSHYLYEQKTPEEYFPKAAESNLKYQVFCEKLGFNPAIRVKDYLEKHLLRPVSIAEQNGQQYTYALVRELKNSALLHADFAGFLDSHWSISRTLCKS